MTLAGTGKGELIEPSSFEPLPDSAVESLEWAQERLAEREAIQAVEALELLVDFAPYFLSVEDPPVEYIIPELIPKGAQTCWHGAPRTMKTLGACRELAPSKQESTTYEPSLVCKLLILGCRLLIPDRLLASLESGIAAATGTPAFGMERFRPRRSYRVLFSSQEDTASIVRLRARKLLSARGITDFPDKLAFAVHKGINFDQSESRERFFDEITSLGFELVIIDPIRAYTAHADKGPADVVPIAKFFRRLIVHGITVLIVHHDTKPPASGPDNRRRSHRASGGGWFSASECPVSFEKIGDRQSLVSPEDYKFSADPKPFIITYDEDANGIRLIGETKSAGEAATLAIDEAVLAYLANHPGESGRAVTKALRKGSQIVADALERLLGANRLECLDLGRGKGKKWTIR